MALLKCKMCGGELNVAEGITVAECEYCGTKQTLPKINDEVIQNLFNRANNLRIKCEFDKAAEIYEKILQENDAEAEAHWGLILCKYGIEYVEDPKTFKRVPTCHRASYEAIVTDSEYLAALEHADAVQKSIYEAEAKAIDEIQKGILNIARNEKPFDVFICYKESDEGGKRTVDSTIANDIYYQLAQEGLKVFYAAITLEDKLGQEYEPYIFAALNSARVMLVIGTKPEYFNAVWVKNEWSRYLKLMKSDRTKLLIPCYRDMDAYDLPEEFAHLQAQNMSKIGFINDIVRGIKKVAVKDEAPKTVVKETVVTSESSNTAPLLKRAFMFLEDGDWNSANEYCEKVLDLDPECAEAYLGKLMADLRVRKQEGLKDKAEPFGGNNNYQKAIRFGDDALKSTLAGYIEHINTRNEAARLDGIYHNAKHKMFVAKTEDEYREAARLFESVKSYKDSEALSKTCLKKAEEARKESIYTQAAHYPKKTIAEVEQAIKLFESIPGYKDADELIVKFKNRIKELEAEAERQRIEAERKRIEAKHKAEEARIEAERKAKRNKKIAIITSSIVCAIIAFAVLWNAVIIPNGKYNDAIALMDAGNLDEAYSIFIELGDYRDASDKARLAKTKERLKDIKFGSYITFGAYEQDNNTSNGKEDIEWFVLEVEEGKALVISKYALDCKQYNTSDTDVTWETCTLREWLNNDFINSAFSSGEKSMIPTVTVPADQNPDYETNSGNATQDQVFVLSITEANKYFSSLVARRCECTEYAYANGVYAISYTRDCQWWLRTRGGSQYSSAYVTCYGRIDEKGYYVNYDSTAVRPALWIDLNS